MVYCEPFLFISQWQILNLKISWKTSNPKDQHAEQKPVCFLDIFRRLLSILMTNDAGMQWVNGELLTEYQPSSRNCFGTLPHPGHRDTTGEQLTGKEVCDAKEWIFRSKNHLLVKLPTLKDLCRGNMGHLYIRGKKCHLEIASARNRKKSTRTSEHCQKWDRVWGNWLTWQQQFPVH